MRSHLIKASLTALLLLHTPAFGQNSIADDIIARIKADGYTIATVERSWLGRIVITARNKLDLREVVVNRTSGEVLRDQRFPIHDDFPDAPAGPDSVDHEEGSGRSVGPDNGRD